MSTIMNTGAQNFTFVQNTTQPMSSTGLFMTYPAQSPFVGHYMTNTNENTPVQGPNAQVLDTPTGPPLQAHRPLYASLYAPTFYSDNRYSLCIQQVGNDGPCPCCLSHQISQDEFMCRMHSFEVQMQRTMLEAETALFKKLQGIMESFRRDLLPRFA